MMDIQRRILVIVNICYQLFIKIAFIFNNLTTTAKLKLWLLKITF